MTLSESKLVVGQLATQYFGDDENQLLNDVSASAVRVTSNGSIISHIFHLH